ncbi:MAG: molybdenum ABC transporter ATP-binding protein [Rhodobiaceae bacterium]|nr:molybdenum ABC transporter ATP-binding protein [Rhodobiaceae bacterium]MCC0054062.1 molybdenum ABC transporter ATP-binding protein [Rhodobiaceae bacterium]
MSIEVSFRHAFADFALDVAFRAPEDGVTALFGPSGCGKTTIINVIAGLVRPASGQVRIGGQTLLDTAGGIDVAARRRRIGYVFQDARLFPHMSVARNLAFGARRAASPLPGPEAERIVSLLGLENLQARLPLNLSGGERQRVALGRALLANPSLLLLDEPLAALDSSRKDNILPYLERLRDEARIPILYVSHSIDEVTRLANEMVVVNDGTVAASGAVDEIMSRLDLFPLTGRFEAGAVLEGLVSRHLPDVSMTEIAVGASRLLVPRTQAPEGSRVRLRVRARDVMLATAPPTSISANNVIEGTVQAVREDAGPYVDVRIDCAGVALLARITKLSRFRLSIGEGRKVWALVKSVSVERTPARAESERR